MAPAAVFAGIAAATAIAGTAVSISAQQSAMNARGKAALRQKRLNDERADDILRRGNINVGRAEQKLKRLKGSQVSAFAKGGVELTGSALEFIAETEAAGRQDLAEIQINARQRARNVRLTGEAQLAEVRDLQSAAEMQMIATGISGVGQAVGSFSSLGGGGKKG